MRGFVLMRMAALVALGLLNVTRAEGQVSVVAQPPARGVSPHYVSNRAPLLASPLVKLPIGAVRPEGWLRKQLELQADGFHGHLTEISRFLKKENNSWLNADGQGEYGWEEVPYWLKGFGDCAYLLGREDQIKETREWVEAVLGSQRDDGFFGPRGQGAKATVESTQGKYDLWPNMAMLNVLQSYHESTGDERVLEFLKKYFRWELRLADEDFLPPYWQQQRGADNLASVYWLYNRTGEPWLLDLAAKVHRNTANWTDGVPNWHNVNMMQAFGGPTTFWMQSGEGRHLEAAERNYRTIREMYGQVPGGLFGGDENCREGYHRPQASGGDLRHGGVHELGRAAVRDHGRRDVGRSVRGCGLQQLAGSAHGGLQGVAIPDRAQHGGVGSAEPFAGDSERRADVSVRPERSPVLPA